MSLRTMTSVPSVAGPTAVVASSGSVEFLAKYVRSSIRKDRKGYCIGFLAVFLVTFFLAFFQSTIDNVRFIFLKTAENEASEADLVLLPEVTPGDPDPTYLLNVSDLEYRSKDVKGLKGISGRWPLVGVVSKFGGTQENNATVTVLAIDSEKEREINLGRFWNGRKMGKQESYISGSLARVLGVKGDAGERVLLTIDLFNVLQSVAISTGGLIIDGTNFGVDFSTEKSFSNLAENGFSIDLGGNTTISTNQTGEASAALEAALAANPATAPFAAALGGTLNANTIQSLFPNGISIPNSEILALIFPTLRDAFVLVEEFIILDTVDYPFGKWPRALGNVLVIEVDEVKRLLLRQVESAFSDLTSSGLLQLLGAETEASLRAQVDAVRKINIDHYMPQANAQFEDRGTIYCESNELMKARISSLSDAFVESLGRSAKVQVLTPLMAVVDAFYFLQLFLNNIFIIVTGLLVFLGSMVVYALLLGNVEAKTYEYGMLRALGMFHNTLSKMLSLNALAFSIPALFTALIVVSLFNIPVVMIFREQVRLPVSYVMPAWSWGLAISLGLCMPYVANILPVKRALSSRLRDALDMYRTQGGEVTVKMQKLADLGLSPELTAFSVCMVGMGFVTFYLMPLSFTLGRIDLFLLLMNVVLVAMLIGMSLVTQTLQRWAESLTLGLYFFASKVLQCNKSDAFLFPIILKNLGAHRTRNQKTSHMLSITAAFLIFAGVMFALQAKLIRYNAAWLLGGDISVTSPIIDSPLPTRRLEETLDNVNKLSEGLVLGHTFMSFNLNAYDFIRYNEVSSMSKVAGGRWNRVIGIEKNFLDVAYKQFVVERERIQPVSGASGTGMDVVDGLFANMGAIKLETEGQRNAEMSTDSWSMNDSLVVSSIGKVGYDSSRLPNAPDYIDCLMSYAMAEYSSVNTKTGAKLVTGVVELSTKQERQFTTVLKPFAMMTKMPTATFSSYSLLASNAPLFVPMEQAQYLLDEARNVRTKLFAMNAQQPTKDLLQNASEPIRVSTMLIKVRRDSTVIEREAIINSISTAFVSGISSLFSVIIVDTRDLIEQTEVAIVLLDVVLGLIGFICMALCFLVSFVSFEANIMENSREFAVLRAVGLTARQVQKAYILEALSLVLSSFFLGSVIGIIIAVSLSLQINLFLESPFEFAFPVENFFILFCMCICVAFVASYVPSKALIREQIAIVIKSGN